MSIWLILIFIMWGVHLYHRVMYSLHIAQLQGYDLEKYMGWLRRNKGKVLTGKTKAFIVVATALTAIYLLRPFHIGAFTVVWMATSLYAYAFKHHESKKPLVLTERAKRLLMGTFLLTVLDFVVVVGMIRLIAGSVHYLPVAAFVLAWSIHFGTYYIIGGLWLLKPLEKSINAKYYKLAQNKIESFEDLKTVGITGSYGKTSTKFITATILEQKFKTYKTPGSYNTPMGLSKAINEELTDQYDVFVAELGAERMGEIKEVARLVQPNIGIITSIGPCHLETFKTIDNIMKTKYELIEELSEEGWSIFNYDNDCVKKLADMTYTKKLLYGLKRTNSVDVYADEIATSSEGSTFTLHIKDKGSVQCTTKLLGKHNILNILAGAAVGYAMGMSLVQIANGIEQIQPVPHRLQILDPGTGVIIIDDAFNSNPDGAMAALEVLESFKQKRRIVVTPGMVELGEMEYEENFKFGQKMAEVCDKVVLIGKKRTKPIQEGLLEQHFSEEDIIVVQSLEASQKVLQTILKPGDVVLFENDLPDTYNEN